MIRVRRSAERGHARHGWLDSFHTFSFAGYNDPDHMGFRAIRVINEDRVQPGRGFDTHSHQDMEIVTYVIEGALEHRDSLGNGSVVRPGDVQRMTAGTGIAHSEHNPSDTDLLHLLQIWILPRVEGLAPSYEQKHFPADRRRGTLRLVASPDGREGSVRVHQDVNLYASLLERGTVLKHDIEASRQLWLQVVGGDVGLGDVVLRAGDGAALSGEPALEIQAERPAEVLVFDLA
jgi:redox-sensitive bicupin YhaK (pirin superfamily)